MQEKTVTIRNISCHHCVMTIQRELGEIPGVEAVTGDPEAKRVTIGWQDPATWEKIAVTLEDIGYTAEV